MREETRKLQQVRGQWNVPTTHRDWNDPRTAVKEQAPLAVEEYRSVKWVTPESTPPPIADVSLTFLIPSVVCLVRTIEHSSSHTDCLRMRSVTPVTLNPQAV